MPSYAYHVTFSKNLAAISKRGLVPGSRSAMGRGGYAGHSGGKTFLSDKEGVDFWYERAEAAANDMSDDPLEEGFVPVVLRMPHPKTAQVDKPGSEDSRHEAWYVTQKLSGIEVWDGSRWLPVSEWRSLDLQQAFQDGDFKYQNDNPLAQLGDDVAAKQNPTPSKSRLRITVSTYRGRPGFLVTGTDEYGSRISIFAKTRQDAEAIRDVYKNIQRSDRQAEISRILLAPKNNHTSKWTKVGPNLWQNGKRHIESLGGGYYELSVGGMRFKTVKSDLAMVKRDWMWEGTYESGRMWKPDPDELRQMHFQRGRSLIPKSKSKAQEQDSTLDLLQQEERGKLNPTGKGKSFKVLPLRTVKKWEPLAKRLGVSKVARSSRGFLRAYEKAGTSSRLPEAWQRKRDGFISRHVAQAKAQGERWFERDGSPTRRHLALIMWAYSPKKVG
jgi:hypothetical protein